MKMECMNYQHVLLEMQTYGFYITIKKRFKSWIFSKSLSIDKLNWVIKFEGPKAFTAQVTAPFSFLHSPISPSNA